MNVAPMISAAIKTKIRIFMIAGGLSALGGVGGLSSVGEVRVLCATAGLAASHTAALAASTAP
jgi:hypothetical protein